MLLDPSPPTILMYIACRHFWVCFIRSYCLFIIQVFSILQPFNLQYLVNKMFFQMYFLRFFTVGIRCLPKIYKLWTIIRKPHNNIKVLIFAFEIVIFHFHFYWTSVLLLVYLYPYDVHMLLWYHWWGQDMQRFDRRSANITTCFEERALLDGKLIWQRVLEVSNHTTTQMWPLTWDIYWIIKI